MVFGFPICLNPNGTWLVDILRRLSPAKRPNATDLLRNPIVYDSVKDKPEQTTALDDTLVIHIEGTD